MIGAQQYQLTPWFSVADSENALGINGFGNSIILSRQ